MVASPFSYFRGAAAAMAWDLAHTPTPDIRVQACGDAHLLNFGMFAAPDRRLVFDVNDFDETLPATFEWDVKRLAASAVIAARDLGFGERDGRAAARMAVSEYRVQMSRFADKTFLDVWYSRIDVDAVNALFDAVQSRAAVRRRHRAIEQAHRRTSLGALAKLCEEVDGDYRIRSAPPLIVRVPVKHHAQIEETLRSAIAEYEQSMSVERREVVNRHHFVDFARKVVGVGSVGTEAMMILLMGDLEDDPLFLQIKEANTSVLAPYAGASEYAHQGERVVHGQRLMQAASDAFLGWVTGTGKDARQFYVRQLRDLKMSAQVELFTPGVMAQYAEVCAWSLARAHARSGDAALITGYLGRSDVFDRAIADFSFQYADQTEADHATPMKAVRAGKLEILTEEEA